MQLTSTQLTRPSISKFKPKKSSSTLLNEPHIPMDRVMRGMGQMDLEVVGEALGAIAIGAASGILSGGSFGTNILTTAGLETGAAFLNNALLPEQADDVGLLISPFYGAATGLVASALGVGLSAVSGLNPVVSMAIAGAATQLGVVILNNN